MRRRRSAARAPEDRSPRPDGEEAHAPSVEVSFKHALSFGPGKLRLLEEIERTGSISASARRMGMSYRRAWDLASGMNAAFREPLVVTQSDGRRLGGAVLTDHGRQVMDLFKRLRAAALGSISEEFSAFREFLADGGGPPGADG